MLGNDAARLAVAQDKTKRTTLGSTSTGTQTLRIMLVKLNVTEVRV